ncbi:MAG: insulinase family protein, partial [Spirochaetales bacterium]|nr:insulinase family protein [Spirochaetales bacterium]
MPEYGGEACLYVHDVTGMEVFFIHSKDTELCCNFMFSTPSEDSKGVAHILEHTILCGSKRYPVKDPFSQVLLSSPNTFLNAITFADKTMYPFASPLKKDFDILFDIYADAVFDPLLRRESFLQEGIRAFGGKFDGVVFNEMCGARSTEDSVVQSCCTRDMFRGTPYEFDSGGDPLCIVDLTYEEYLNRYRKWYSPSNCRLFVYGDLDVSEYLDKLEQRYLKGCKKGEKIIPKSENYMQYRLKPIRIRESCPAGDSRSVVLSWLTTEGSDTLEVLTVSVLVDILLGNPGAPLYKAITESDLGEDLNPLSGTDVDSPVLTFTVGFSHAKEGSEDEIERFLIDQISSYVKDGLPSDAVEAAIKRLEFKEQEIPTGGLPFGLTTCLKVARSWMRGRNPEEGALSLDRLRKLKEKVASGRYFESWMQKNILDNQRRCLLTVESDDDYDSVFHEKLQRKYEQKVSSGMNPEKDRALFERFVNTPDSPEALATIERICLSDLPKTIARYEQSRKRLPCKAVFYDYRLFTRGIVYLSIAFDTRGLDLEEKRLLPLLVRSMQMCGTKRHSFSEISTLVKMLTGSFFMYPSAGSDVHQKPVSTVVVKAKALK